MAQRFEYKSVYKTRQPGDDRYTSADDLLNAEGANGWELVCVSVISGVYVTAVYEVFYFVKKITTDT